MKFLSDIVYGVRLNGVEGTMNMAIECIQFDSRKVKKHCAFVAVKGTQSDGHAFIEKAIASGAAAIICSELPAKREDHITYVLVNDTAEALGIMASNFYDNPSEKLTLVGVTGTNGKTTTVTLLFDLFTWMGNSSGLLSTVENRIGKNVVPATHTTPDPVQLNELLREMVDAGCKFCFMEVSSHAVHQKRIAGLKFAAGLFTNITHDHLDYHQTFENYLAAKKAFFDSLAPEAWAIANADDYHAEQMMHDTKARKLSYGIRTVSDIRCKIVESDFSGQQLSINGKEVWTRLIGGFNAYNVAAAYALASRFQTNEMEILTGLSTLTPAEGRFHCIAGPNHITGIVDYAHTPDALKNVLLTVRDIREGSEKIITVVGCGGDRDKTKRPLMAQIASELSDKVIITSDNPRSEEPDAIVREMQAGIPVHLSKNVLNIIDRREAIRTAVALAQPGDIILVAGKGHEKYQEIKGVKHPFDDVTELSQNFKSIAN